jgi:hypothetical protein
MEVVKGSPGHGAVPQRFVKGILLDERRAGGVDKVRGRLHQRELSRAGHAVIIGSDAGVQSR